jgi:hypothetical protein
MTKMNQYLKTLRENNYTPNFWCSEEYFCYAGWKTENYAGRVSVKDDEGNLMLPIISNGKIIIEGFWWSGLMFKSFEKYDFLDYNFIYNPSHFLNLEGSKWKIFRKNIKKFPRNKNGLRYDYIDDAGTVADILVDWLSARKEDETIHDDEVILKYLNHPEKKILFDDNEIYGINIWDENFKFVNYRFCFVKDFPFLSEYMRYLFYTDEDILNKNKLVNDGGSLDNEGLFNFKVRLNPIEAIKITTKYKEKES